MGNELKKHGFDSSTKTSSEDKDCNSEVMLNVYDLIPFNHYTYWFGFGIFHSGLQVHGMEYGFGAHDLSSSGVFEVEPRCCPGFIYRCSIPLGHTNMSPSEFRTFIEGMASEYHGDTYHLITKNCNHFTDDMAHRMIGKGIPGWVNRLARTGALCSCLLPESLQVTTVKQLPETEYHECLEEDGTESFSTDDGFREHTESEDTDHDKHLLLSPKTENVDFAFVKEVEHR